jgi:CheY-like chemotaxis protein
MAAERILVVDDNPQNLKLLRVLLRSEGYVVQTVADAEHAIDTIPIFAPHLILMDVQLPGMDGLELTRRLKAAPETLPILVIAVTSYAMKGDEEKALAAGCDGYVSKPIDVGALPAMIASYLERARPGEPSR